ncbi:MAG TPA: methyltransferase domain-containing protein [Solirubrobacterales bacterium]|nr:methyltransferase domain-containing protein [Solirubrobacterales bacterium]
MTQLEFDEETSKRIEASYSSRDVLRRRALVREAIGAAPGQRILDVGCGPGFYAAELAAEVGADGGVTGVDGSDAMLALARRRNSEAANVEFVEGDATALPVADDSFDAALSVQVLEYVAEIPAALAEVRRVLRPGGRLVIWDVDWATLSIRTADPARMRRVLDVWDEHLTHVSLPATLTARLRDAGFEDATMEGHSFATNELSPDTYGGFIVGFIEQFVIDREALPADEAHAWADEQRELAERGEFYFAVIQSLFSARAPA